LALTKSLVVQGKHCLWEKKEKLNTKKRGKGGGLPRGGAYALLFGGGNSQRKRFFRIQEEKVCARKWRGSLRPEKLGHGDWEDNEGDCLWSIRGERKGDRTLRENNNN